MRLKTLKNYEKFFKYEVWDADYIQEFANKGFSYNGYLYKDKLIKVIKALKKSGHYIAVFRKPFYSNEDRRLHDTGGEEAYYHIAFSKNKETLKALIDYYAGENEEERLKDLEFLIPARSNKHYHKVLIKAYNEIGKKGYTDLNYEEFYYPNELIDLIA